jgi:hypothetical protein
MKDYNQEFTGFTGFRRINKIKTKKLYALILTILSGAELDGRRPSEGCTPGMAYIKILKNPVNPVK